MNTTLLTILSFLLFAFITKFPFVYGGEAKQVVVDSDGNPVLPENEYYIVPPPEAKLGGVTPYQIAGLQCPTSVTQLLSHTNNGQPVRFIVSRSSRIFTGTTLDIEFAMKPNCTKSSKWSAFYNSYLDISFLGIDNFDYSIQSGMFHIELSRKDNNSSIYKLVFCVSRSTDCKPVSYFNNGAPDARQLLLSFFDSGLEFRFIKVTKS